MPCIDILKIFNDFKELMVYDSDHTFRIIDQIMYRNNKKSIKKACYPDT